MASRVRSWLWLTLVLGVFGLPLFIGLGRTDLRGDEAIYAFAVDRTLETGDWLIQRSSPFDDWPFLEKPPLKIWIVAGAIRLGLLPLDEFGLRFWDAVFGAAAFLYVFAIGRRMAGPWCGLAAVVLLFAHAPLLFDHGLRDHTMEAALVLSYCGGVYHYLAWASPGGRRRDAIACALLFVLGFMTKFVAAAFLPIVLGAAAAATPAHREALLLRRGDWLAAAAVTTVCVVPWFAYAWAVYGWTFWNMILGVQVYTRFTTFVDPTHLQPWHFYVSRLFTELAQSGAALLVPVGFALLLARTARTRWPEGVLVIVWMIVPPALISFGTSKLYHYLYPFLPAAALAGGYAVSVSIHRLDPAVRVALNAAERWSRRRWPLLDTIQRSRIGTAAAVLAVVAAAVAVATAYAGVVEIWVAGERVLRNSGIGRPLLAAAVLAAAAGRLRWVGRAVVLAATVLLLPLGPARANLERLPIEDHPIRSLRDCLAGVFDRASPAEGPGLHAEAGNPPIPHVLNYYLRQLRPWERGAGSDEALRHRLMDRGAERPVLLLATRDARFAALHTDTAAIPRLSFAEYVLRLPGPYVVCAVRGPNSAKR